MRRLELSDADHGTIAALVKARRDMHNSYANDRMTPQEVEREKMNAAHWNDLLETFNSAETY